MIASRQDVQHALRTILGREPSEITLNCWVSEVQRRNLSAVQLSILCLTRNEFGPQNKSMHHTALDILQWDDFVERFVKAKEEQISALGGPGAALSELGVGSWFHSFELSDGTLIPGNKTLGVLKAEFDAVFAPLTLDGQVYWMSVPGMARFPSRQNDWARPTCWRPICIPGLIHLFEDLKNFFMSEKIRG